MTMKRALVVVAIGSALAACGTVLDTSAPDSSPLPVPAPGEKDGGAETGATPVGVDADVSLTNDASKDARPDAPKDADPDSSTGKPLDGGGLLPDTGTSPPKFCTGSSLFCDDFQEGDKSGWTTTTGADPFTLNGAFAVVDKTRASNGVQQYVSLNVETPLDISFQLRIPRPGDVPFFRLEDPATFNNVNLVLSGTNTLMFGGYVGGLSTGASTTQFPKDEAWHAVRVVADFGANGGGQLYLDGIPVGGPITFGAPETKPVVMTLGVPNGSTFDARIELDDIVVR